MSQPSCARKSTVDLSSTPSATVFILRDLARARASDTTILVRGLSSLPRKKPASSLRMSRGISFNELRDEYPVPKSSMETRKPYDLRRLIVVIMAFSSSKKALSVSSISMSERGHPSLSTRLQIYSARFSVPK